MHVIANSIISFFFMVEKYSIVYMYHIFIHSSVDGHRLFPCLDIVNNATMNTGVHASFRIRDSVFSRYMPRSGIEGSYGSSNLVF